MIQRTVNRVIVVGSLIVAAATGIGLACSTVDDGSGDGPEKGHLDCFVFPGAQAWDEATMQWQDLELVEFPQFCWCAAEDYTVSSEQLEQLTASALGECIWTALYLGYDATQTTCIDVMLGPEAGGFRDDPTCVLKGESLTVYGDGETGGESSEEPVEPQLGASSGIVDASASTIDWSDGGWPEFVPLGCDLNRDCCELFATDICRYTDPNYPMHGSLADWAVADTKTEIDIAYQGCPEMGGPELVLDGRADFSIAACDDARCPVYLPALTLELPTDATGRFSTSLFDGRCADKTIERFELRLVHAALGSRDPSTGRIAFPIGSMVFETEVDVSAERGEFGAGEYSFLAFNDRVVWGHASEDGGLRLEPESLSFEQFGFQLGVKFDATVVGSPPTVRVAPPRMIACEHDQGMVTIPLFGFADDVDGDLLNAYWLLGEDVVNGPVAQLPLGQHAVAYRAVDRRGASSTVEVSVSIEATDAGEYSLTWTTMDEQQVLTCPP